MSKYFPSSLNVSGRNCWVIGNDREAIEKAVRLAEAGGHVTVVSPEFGDEAMREFNKWKVAVLTRPFRLEDLNDQFFVVFSAKNDAVMAEKIWRVCRERKILLCAIDQPRFCDVVNSSQFKKGRLTMVISTDGAAPGVSRKIRLGLEESLQEAPIDRFLDDLAALRERLEKEEKNPDERVRRLLAAIEGFKFHGKVDFPRAWLQKKEEAN